MMPPTVIVFISIGLTDKQIQTLEKAFPIGETFGERYPLGGMKTLSL